MMMFGSLFILLFVGILFVGLVAGLALSLSTFRALEDFLFEIGTLDPGTLFLAALLLTAASLAAAFIPARRAAVMDPVQALKRE